MPAGFQYYPERNARAYSTALLAQRLRALVAQRQMHGAAPSADRWAETMRICNELHHRQQEPILVTDAIAMGPEGTRHPLRNTA